METREKELNKHLSTPGEILREEFMEPLKISSYKLAHTISTSQTAIGEILNGKRAISVAMAYKLSKAFRTTPDFWLNLQRDYDILRFDESSIGNITPLVSE
ncbi:HigA family addiction module antitoxin [Gardnerella vaginalis]|uniref:HigA family addiction module antitoxin n=1 Tax=Gardnerella vaginalis TaxID=2702 RepID=UPI0039EF3FEC